MTTESPPQLPKNARNNGLVSVIWPDLRNTEYDHAQRKHYNRLFEYFERELSIMDDNVDFFAIACPLGIAPLISKLREIKGGLARAEAIDVARKVVGPGPSEDMVMRSVDLAVRIWLTLDVSSLALRRPGLLTWTSKQTLVEVVESHFANLEQEQCRNPLSDGDIDPELKAEHLVRYYGYAIIWTDNLASHLAVDWRHKTLAIYEHKITLYNHLRFPDTSIVPKDVLGEAVDTLNLLFPFQDDATKRFLAKRKKQFYGLGMCSRPRKLKLSDYSYWRSRVADLVYISSGPAVGLQQLRLSRKGDNLLQFATFWTATAVGLLTIVSIAIGVAATVYGAKQYDLAMKQYDISIFQLCLDPLAQERLSSVCSGVGGLES